MVSKESRLRVGTLQMQSSYKPGLNLSENDPDPGKNIILWGAWQSFFWEKHLFDDMLKDYAITKQEKEQR